MTQPDRLQRALARLILRHPFLPTLALRLERVEDPSAGASLDLYPRSALSPDLLARAPATSPAAARSPPMLGRPGAIYRALGLRGVLDHLVANKAQAGDVVRIGRARRLPAA